MPDADIPDDAWLEETRQHKQRLIRKHYRHLHALEEQKALQGLSTPVTVRLEIEDVKENIQEEEAKLKAVEAQIEQGVQVRLRLPDAPRWEYSRISWMVRQVTEQEKREIEAGPDMKMEFFQEAGSIVAKFGFLDFDLSEAEEPTTRTLITHLGDATAQLERDGWEMYLRLRTRTNMEVYYFRRPCPKSRLNTE